MNRSLTKELKIKVEILERALSEKERARPAIRKKIQKIKKQLLILPYLQPEL